MTSTWWVKPVTAYPVGPADLFTGPPGNGCLVPVRWRPSNRYERQRQSRSPSPRRPAAQAANERRRPGRVKTSISISRLCRLASVWTTDVAVLCCRGHRSLACLILRGGARSALSSTALWAERRTCLLCPAIWARRLTGAISWPRRPVTSESRIADDPTPVLSGRRVSPYDTPGEQHAVSVLDRRGRATSSPKTALKHRRPAHRNVNVSHGRFPSPPE
jgi:hypothetical protein